MTPGPGIEPGTHWWKASALTTTPTLLPDNYTLIKQVFDQSERAQGPIYILIFFIFHFTLFYM